MNRIRIAPKLLACGAIAGLALTVARADEKIDFAKLVKPIFESRCIECHGAEKQKGDLRLDSGEVVKAGGDHKAIVPGKADESEVIKHVSLPAGHDDIMPPKGDPLTKEQIEILRKWINEGAHWPEGLVLGGPSEAAKRLKPPGWEFANLTKPADTSGEPAAIQKLGAMGISVRPVAQNLDWKEATVRPQDTNKTAEAVALLRNIPTLVDLNLAGLKISDADLDHIAPLVNLVRLHLENTPVTDAGLAKLKGLKNLRYLNLYNTSVGDASIDTLKGMPNLSNLYLWQTKITDDGAAALKKAVPAASINRGEELKMLAKLEEELAAKRKAEEEAKKAEEAKKKEEEEKKKKEEEEKKKAEEKKA